MTAASGAMLDLAVFVPVHGLQVDKQLHQFVEAEILPGLTLTSEDFWSGFAELFGKFTDRNRQLLLKRKQIQERIDAWRRLYQPDGWQCL